MAKTALPKDCLRLIFELIAFLMLCVPGILWACLKNLLPPKQKSVEGQVVLITGTARGLGRELAVSFSKLGAKVACVDILEDENNETVQVINSKGNVAVSYTCDVSKRDQVKALHDQIREDLGPVDMLINNASIVWGHTFIDFTKDQFIVDLINVNIIGYIWMIREILPSMLKRNKGHIVAMSSLSSMSGIPGISSYSASKWAIRGMMECLQNELREIFNSNVKTTTVMPYFVETNPKISKLLNIRIPEIPVHVAGKMMVKGILEEKRIFSVPRCMMFISSIIRLLPDNLQILFSKILYVNILQQDADINTVNEYKQTNTCAN